MTMQDFFAYFSTARNVMLLVFLIIAIATFFVILCSKPSEAQKWMLVASIGIIIYFAMNLAPGGTDMVPRKAIYIATCWFGLGAVLSLMSICNVYLPKGIKYGAVIFAILLSLAIVTINYHDGWDKIIMVESTEDPGTMVEKHVNGWMYYVVNIGLLVVLLAFSSYLAIMISRKKGSKRNALTLIAIFLGIPAIAWLISLVVGNTTAKSNFVLFIGLDAAIMVLQIRYDILTTLPVAKEQIVEGSDEGVIILDAKNRFLYANAAARMVFKELADNNEDRVTVFVKEKLLSSEPGTRYDIEDKNYALYRESVYEDGKTIGTTLWLKNITNEVKYSDMLLKRSETDLMTGLMNRGGGEKKISERIARGDVGMFCLLDADHFKSYNDTFGHAVGDAVICAIADTLSESLKSEDSIVMRLGGDEFAFFVGGITTEEEGRKIIDKFFRTMEVVRVEGTDDREICVSLGATLYDGRCTDSFDVVYHAADEGTYASKKTEGTIATFVTIQTGEYEKKREK